MIASCHDPKDGVTLDHAAEGWLVCPDGRRIVAMCRRHADGVIAEYRGKLGEAWTFEPAPGRMTFAGGGPAGFMEKER